MTGKQWDDMKSYLPQTGAPQELQAKNTEGQKQEDQSQNQSHTLVDVVLGLLLFSHLNLQAMCVQCYIQYVTQVTITVHLTVLLKICEEYLTI